MNAPDLTYEFYIKDAHAHWSIHCDAIHITECDSESGVTVNGVNADKMFMMCRNALACKREYSVFKELTNKPYNIKAAQEMMDALKTFIEDNTIDGEEE